MKNFLIIGLIIVFLVVIVSGCGKQTITGYYNEKDLNDFNKIVEKWKDNGCDFYMKKIPIVQIVSSQGVKGSGGGFLVFSFQMESELYFSAYINENNKINLIKMPANKTNIYEDSDLKEICLVQMGICNDYERDGQISSYRTYYNIHIPPNSISKFVDLNLKKQ